MRSLELAKRNFKETWRDWLSLGVNVALPVLMLLVLQALEGVDAFFAPTSLAPGVAVFGFAMLTMSSAMTLAQDRETSLFARLLTARLTRDRPRARFSCIKDSFTSDELPARYT